MFIFDTTSCLIVAISFIVIYLTLDYLNLENMETKESKIMYSIVISILITISYAWFFANGTEELIQDSFPEAAVKFGGVAELDNVRSLSDI